MIFEKANCCYPANQHLLYEVKADLVLQDDVQVNDHVIYIRLNQSQNIEMESINVFAQQMDTPIFKVKFKWIKLV